MSDQADFNRLMSWSADDVIPQDSYNRLEGHPRYVEAVRLLSSQMLAAAAADKALDGIAKDGGRYVAAQWAMYLHASGGLTLPRLKEICVASRLLSPGRARAVLLYLLYLRYVETSPDRKTGEPQRYRPTSALSKAWMHLVRASLEAVRLVEPAVDAILATLDRPEVLDSFLQHQGGGFLVAAQALPRENHFVRVFVHRHAGMQTLHWMIDASGKTGDEFPPQRPIAVPIASVARQLRVSRTHIKRLLNEGVREGLLLGCGEGTAQFTARLAFDTRFVLSTLLIGALICAAKTARDVVMPRERARQVAAAR